MIKPQDGWWYSVVAASPDPEVGDLVNIALVTGRGTHGDVEFLTDLPKLACLVGPGETAMFRGVLGELARQVGRGQPLDMLRGAFGPQLRISEPRRLLQAPTEKTRRNLRHKFLENQRARSRRDGRGASVRETRDELDNILTPRLPLVRIGYVKTVTPEALYPANVGLFGSSVPTLDRALTTDRRHLLIGGVLVSRARTPKQMRDNAARVYHAFWQYQSAREQIFKNFDKEIRLLGIIIAEDDSNQSLEGRDLAKHMLSQPADAVAASDRFNFGGTIDEEIAWVAQS